MSHGEQRENPYYQGHAQDGGSGYGQPNPYSQDQYEMQAYGHTSGDQPQQQPASTSGVLTASEFRDQTQQLREETKKLDGYLDHIKTLHQRMLSSAADATAKEQMEHYVTLTQTTNASIKDGFKRLQRDLNNTRDTSKSQKASHLKSSRNLFEEKLSKYTGIEAEYRDKYRDQIARQFRTVNPDATDEEVNRAVNADWSNEGVFQQALMDNRLGHASSKLGNVRARHNELLQIERSIQEVAELQADLARVVDSHEPQIVAAEDDVMRTTDNLEEGNKNVGHAIVSARNYRKYRWWCLGLVVIIIIAIALGVGLGICLTTNKCGSSH